MARRYTWGDVWSWSDDEVAVAIANHARGDSLELSARILRRTPLAVRAVEYKFGLKRSA